MQDFRATASLSSGLLARKGAAKPAMRRQFPTLGSSAKQAPSEEQLEDLGWNDMGEEQPASTTGQPTAAEQQTETALEQQQRLAETYQRAIRFDSTQAIQDSSSENAEAALEAEADPPAPAPTAAPDADQDERTSLLTMSQSGTSCYRGGRERSFTLRMSEERHQQLREVCERQNCSAQLLVSNALDQFLDKITQRTI